MNRDGGEQGMPGGLLARRVASYRAFALSWPRWPLRPDHPDVAVPLRQAKGRIMSPRTESTRKGYRGKGPETQEQKETERRRALAAKLAQLTDRQIEFVTKDDGEPVFAGQTKGVDTMQLDERNGDLEQQLIEELARVGRLYFQLAQDVGKKCGKPAPIVEERRNNDPLVIGSPWGYIGAKDAIQWLSLPEHEPRLKFEYGEVFTRFWLEDSESAMYVRNCEPIRMQIIKELLRVADYFDFAAQRIKDTDYCDAELEYEDRETLTLKWLSKIREGDFAGCWRATS
jgi:hypothetical protein